MVRPTDDDAWGIGVTAEDRCLVEAIRLVVGDAVELAGSHLDAQSLPMRSMVGGEVPVEDAATALSNLGKARRLARTRGLPIHGHFGGEPAEDSAHLFRAVVRLFASLPQRPLAVVVGQDSDHRVARRRGFEQVRRADAAKIPFPLLLAAPEPECEAWQVAGFEPEDAGEKTALASVQKELGWDPVARSERLTSTGKGRSDDSKHVAQQLLGEDQCRRRDALRRASDAARAGQGPDSLVRFVTDIEREVVPILR